MEIRVERADWGDAGLEPCIEKLLADVASHISRLLRNPLIGSIMVKPAPSTQDYPVTLPRSSPEDPYPILLSARGRFWAQFSYQFAHEFCHVLCGYERLRNNPNNWFVEALCELASIFTIRRMAERWTTQPPCPGWESYAASLASYNGLEPLLTNSIQQLLRNEETYFREISTRTEFGDYKLEDRVKFAAFSHCLLPIFESHPAGWNAARKLPNSEALFKDYLLEWHTAVDESDKPFVSRILSLFGMTP